MNQIQVALQLDQLIQAGPTLFMKLEPEIVDFTQNASFKIICLAKSVEFSIEIDSDNVIEILSLIKAAIFDDEKISVIGWNLKNLFTYAKAHTCGELDFNCKILDLKLAECFIGVRERVPAQWPEVVSRLKRLFADSSWPKCKIVHKSVYLPLLSKVIPDIETEGVFNTEKRQILFPYYEIEGQTGGRLSTQMAYVNCFNPHSLDDEQKAQLQPKGNDLTFLCFDYHFHEVCVLAWLSQDEALLSLVDGEGDFYRKLYKQLTKTECDSDKKRSFCKDYLFLPVIYGQSAKTLAERTKLDVAVAEKLITGLKGAFPKLFSWVEDYAPEGEMYVDYIGRKRKPPVDEEYKYRNFIVQSPGAIFCLEKLVRLHEVLGNYGRIVAHIHDGYVVRAYEKQAETVSLMCLKVLEAESELFPGLKLRTNCKISKTLA